MTSSAPYSAYGTIIHPDTGTRTGWDPLPSDGLDRGGEAAREAPPNDLQDPEVAE